MNGTTSSCLLAVLAGALLSMFAACEEKKPTTPGPSPAAPGPSAAGGDKKTRIAVVPKGTTHEFWKSVHAGALDAGREAGVEVVFRGPEKEDDREQQIALVQNLIAAKYDAIVLAPLDNAALVNPVKQATGTGIPVVIIDSGLDAEAGKDFASYVATDNIKAGELAGEHLARSMGGKGRALILRYMEGSLSTVQREQGFVTAIGKHPGITLVDPKRYSGATRATAQEASENLLAANQDIAGVFCPNESSTFGMLLALRSRGMLGTVKFVGFDASDEVLRATRAGEMQGFVVQNPFRMGYLGVKTAIDRLKGRDVPTGVDTGVMLITTENVETPEAKAMLSPDLSKLPGGS